ncbi:MAG: hypothetical protein ACFE8C_03330 [Promethearchaeota archaeon]
MNKKEKNLTDTPIKKKSELNLPEFYAALNKAISNHNLQSIYDLSKIFTRYYFKNLER